MAQVHGYNTFFAWGKESTYGTAVAAAKYVEIEKESLREGRKYAHKPLLRTLSRNRRIKEKMAPAGSIRLPMLKTGLEQLLENAFGASSAATTGPASGVYTHTFTLKAAVPVGLTAYVSRDADATGAGTCYRYAGAHISKLTLDQAVGEWLMVDAEFIARIQAQTTNLSPSYPTFTPYDYSHMTVFAINPASANVAIPLRSLKVMIDNKYDLEGYRLGSEQRQVVNREGQREVSFEFEMELNAEALIDYYQALSETDLQFKWVIDADTDLTLTLPKVVFDGENPAIDGPGAKILSMSGSCVMNAADNDELTLVLRNATSAV